MPGPPVHLAQQQQLRPQAPSHGKYRPDVDGLRAVAVLLVIAFHLDLSLPRGFGSWLGRLLHRPAGFVSLFPRGGFVGVDIFFVISGFLIGGILLREQSRRTISLANFYERRIRRILPALSAVLLVTFLAAWFSFLPTELAEFSRSEIAALFSWSNLFFWQSSGYFDVPALSQQLLHTWSLSVEEQFYLAFPLALILLKRFAGRTLTIAMVVATLASFFTSVFMVARYPTAAFYLAPSRAWELLIGALLPLGVVPLPRSSRSRNLASSTGLVLILYAGFRFSAHMGFPGTAALVPCIGALLILASGVHGTSVVGAALSTRPLVFIGLISYSLYLWHWPLLLASRYEYVPHLRFTTGPLLLIIFVVAVASWALIEQPFRKARATRRTVFIAAAITATLLVLANLSTIQSGGFPGRFPSQVVSLDHYRQQASTEAKWGDGCFTSTVTATLARNCLSVSTTQPNFLLFGSSHAAHLWYGLSTAYPQIHFLQATGSQCDPLLSSLASSQPFCKSMATTVFEQFLPSHKIDGVILAAVWYMDDAVPLEVTVAQLRAQHLRVYVIGPIVGYDEPLPKLLFRSLRLDDAAFVTRHRSMTESEYAELDQHLEKAALSSGADRYISLRKVLCPAGECLRCLPDTVPLQSDETHLTNEGSLFLARRLRQLHLFP